MKIRSNRPRSAVRAICWMAARSVKSVDRARIAPARDMAAGAQDEQAEMHLAGWWQSQCLNSLHFPPRWGRCRRHADGGGVTPISVAFPLRQRRHDTSPRSGGEVREASKLRTGTDLASPRSQPGKGTMHAQGNPRGSSLGPCRRAASGARAIDAAHGRPCRPQDPRSDLDHGQHHPQPRLHGLRRAVRRRTPTSRSSRRWRRSTRSRADKLTWTFTLRDGLEWHDGKPVTAEDCVASIRAGARATASASS